MDVGQRIAPAGLGDEGDDRGEQQDRLQPFAQQDHERGGECRGGREFARFKSGLRSGEQRIGARDALLERVGRRAIGDRTAHRQHFALDLEPERLVEVVERILDQLEALEVGGDREIARRGPVAAAIGDQALAEFRARVGDRRGFGGLERLGMRAQVGLREFRLRAVATPDLVRRVAGQARQIGERGARLAVAPGILALLPARRRCAEVGDVERKRPAPVFAELREGRHGSAGDAQCDRVVEAVQAAFRHARGVVEIRRRGIEVFRGGTVAAALGAVAGGAIRGVERGPAPDIRSAARRDLQSIGADERPAQRRRGFSHCFWRRLVGDEFHEPAGIGDERILRRVCRQHLQPLLRLSGELRHFLVFVGALDPAAFDRPCVVHADVVKKVNDALCAVLGKH